MKKQVTVIYSDKCIYQIVESYKPITEFTITTQTTQRIASESVNYDHQLLFANTVLLSTNITL